jgi:nucleotide-binding universal stress UspA family protein
MTYKRILVPFDGSSYSKKALTQAAQIAKSSDAIIYLCTIITTQSVVPPGALLGLVKEASRGTLQKRLVSSAKIQAEKQHVDQIKYCEKLGVRAFSKILVSGNIAQEILSVAKKKSADLIVIGSQGLHGMAKLKSLGSVSRKVSESASCPVLIVR